MIDKERVAELAKLYVCPLNGNPSTPYEFGMVRQCVSFALMVLTELGESSLGKAEVRGKDNELE